MGVWVHVQSLLGSWRSRLCIGGFWRFVSLSPSFSLSLFFLSLSLSLSLSLFFLSLSLLLSVCLSVCLVLSAGSFTSQDMAKYDIAIKRVETVVHLSIALKKAPSPEVISKKNLHLTSSGDIAILESRAVLESTGRRDSKAGSEQYKVRDVYSGVVFWASNSFAIDHLLPSSSAIWWNWRWLAGTWIRFGLFLRYWSIHGVYRVIVYSRHYFGMFEEARLDPSWVTRCLANSLTIIFPFNM